MTEHYDTALVYTGPLFIPTLDANGRTYMRYEVMGPSQVVRPYITYPHFVSLEVYLSLLFADHVRSQVAVPTHFFKVVLGETAGHAPEVMAFVLPNAMVADTVPMSSFLTTLEAVEKCAGFLLFERLEQRYALVKRDANGGLLMVGKPS